MNRHTLAALSLTAALGMSGMAAQAQTAPAGGAAVAVPAQRSVSDWLARIHEASRQRTYAGTFVVSSAGGNLASARIWHACDGVQQMERVETLTGAPRSTFRRNSEVVTFLPDSKIARKEVRESLGVFPGILKSHESSIPDFYTARAKGQDRVAGFDADVVQLEPRDELRFGYRIWSEKKTGLVVKLQTLDARGRVLEQAAFSELQLDVPVKMDSLAQMMANTDGYRVEKVEPVRTTAEAEGWALRSPIAGFQPVGCYKRPAAGVPDGVVQWIFSDGLASVSLFLEPHDRRRHSQELLLAMGATVTLTRRVPDKSGDWWLTAVGEVPPQTLNAFALGLERRR